MPATKLPNLGIFSGWYEGEDGWAEGMSANLLLLDTNVQLGVLSRVLNDPPGGPEVGDTYIIGVSPTGVWGGRPGALTVYYNNEWQLYTPKAGWRAFVIPQGAFYYFNGSTWLPEPGSTAIFAQWKDPARLAFNTNQTAAALTAGSVYQGVTLVAGDRLALLGQTSLANNGMWTVQASGGVIRSADMDTGGDILNSAFYVTSGTFAGQAYVNNNTSAIALGSDNITFSLLFDQSVLVPILAGKADKADLDAEIARALAAEADIIKVAIGRPLLDPYYVAAIVGRDDRKLIGFTHFGTTEVNDCRPLLDPVWAYAEVRRKDMSVVRGIRHDGTRWPDGVSSSGDTGIYRATVKDNEVILWNSELDRRSALTFNTPAGVVNSEPQVAGNFVRYLRDDGTDIDLKQIELTAKEPYNNNITRIDHHTLNGQSLSEGTGADGSDHTTAVAPGVAGMFNAGIRTRGAAIASAVVPPENMESIINAFEETQEGPGAGLGWSLAQGAPVTRGFLISAHGRGGTTIEYLMGGQEWANMVAARDRGQQIASINALEYVFSAMSWIQGEANASYTEAQYTAQLVLLRQKLTTDFGSGALLILDQIHNFAHYDYPLSGVPLAQLNFALDTANTICVGPKYMLPTNSDGVHLPKESYARLGSYHGKAKKVGASWKPLYCTGFVRDNATTFRLNTNCPVGNLVIDTTAVSDPGNKGLTWNQTGGTAQTLQSVAVSGQDIIAVLSGDPGSFSASSFFGIAYPGVSGAAGGPTTGPRSCFRDQDVTPDIYGVAMPNWACHQKVLVNP